MVVLSSNDGCAVARSNEAKALGIPMGAPAFKYRQLFKDEGVVQCSANFELYGDISSRIVRLLTDVTPRTEVYSVDESFLDLSQLEITDYQQWGHWLRERLLREIGIPVAIGIAPSKTLAKLADHRAKLADNVLDITHEGRALHLLQTPVNEVWGVGWRLAPKLKAEGIYNALDLSQMSPRLAQQVMGVQGRRLVMELNGTSCHALDPIGKVRQTIMHGRQFGEDTNQFQVIEAAIARLTGRAMRKLRKEGLLTKSAAFRLTTNRHHPGYTRLGRNLRFATPTADTGFITKRLIECLEATLNPNLFYHRADVMFYDLVDANRLQPDFFNHLNLAQLAASQTRLQAFDSINNRYGNGTIRYAAEDLSQSWQPRRNYVSPTYTTDWSKLPLIGS